MGVQARSRRSLEGHEADATARSPRGNRGQRPPTHPRGSPEDGALPLGVDGNASAGKAPSPLQARGGRGGGPPRAVSCRVPPAGVCGGRGRHRAPHLSFEFRERPRARDSGPRHADGVGRSRSGDASGTGLRRPRLAPTRGRKRRERRPGSASGRSEEARGPGGASRPVSASAAGEPPGPSPGTASVSDGCPL